MKAAKRRKRRNHGGESEEISENGEMAAWQRIEISMAKINESESSSKA